MELALRIIRRTGNFTRALWVGMVFLLGAAVAGAFPPAPPHTIFGLIRGEDGSPLTQESTRIVFESDNGTVLEAPLMPGLAPGINYEILVPMDAGITDDLYRPDAMSPDVPFRITVLLGGESFVPLEMSGNTRLLGEPGESTRIDLTLGLDSDGDGLPDAWKDSVIALSGNPDLARADITPDGDVDGDGLTNMEEYIAGTYAWDAADRFVLEILEADASGRAVLEFLAIDGRTYSLEASRDMQSWATVPFRLVESDPAGFERSYFFASTVRVVTIEVQGDAGGLNQYRLSVR